MYIITGAAGFIGSNLTNAIMKEKNEVIAIDNLHTGSEANLSSLKGIENFRFVKANAGELERHADNENIEMVFHQGIYSSSPMYRENPKFVSVAIADFISLLELCRKKNVKLVFASSSSVYNGNAPPHKEEMPVHVTDYYTEARYSMERLAELYNKLYGMKIIGLRYFSVYGPHEQSKGNYANLISQFIWSMLKKEQPVVYGNGEQTRDFIYVEDVVKANLLAAKFPVSFGIFNVGTGRSININEMLELLGKTLNCNISPRYVENKIKNYVQHTRADVTRAESVLGFKAAVSLEEGITKTVEYYKELRYSKPRK